MAEAATAVHKVEAMERVVNTAVIPRGKEAVPEAEPEAIREILRDKREGREQDLAFNEEILPDLTEDPEVGLPTVILPDPKEVREQGLTREEDIRVAEVIQEGAILEVQVGDSSNYCGR